MATITFKGNPVQTSGDLPAKDAEAPDFTLTNAGLEDVGLKSFAGKRKILNIVPSLDTGVCAMSARAFNASGVGDEGTPCCSRFRPTCRLPPSGSAMPRSWPT